MRSAQAREANKAAEETKKAFDEAAAAVKGKAGVLGVSHGHHGDFQQEKNTMRTDLPSMGGS